MYSRINLAASLALSRGPRVVAKQEGFGKSEFNCCCQENARLATFQSWAELPCASKCLLFSMSSAVLNSRTQYTVEYVVRMIYSTAYYTLHQACRNSRSLEPGIPVRCDICRQFWSYLKSCISADKFII